jgi:hypothetical protein
MKGVQIERVFDGNVLQDSVCINYCSRGPTPARFALGDFAPRAGRRRFPFS